MAAGDKTDIGQKVGSSGTTETLTVTTAPTAPSNPCIRVKVGVRDAPDTANAVCADSRGNTYTRTKVSSGSGITELNDFYSIGATPLQDGDTIVISGLIDTNVRSLDAYYLEGIDSLFGVSAGNSANSVNGVATTSGSVASMPDGAIADGSIAWSNQPSTGVFTTLTQDGSYPVSNTGAASSGGSAGQDRAVGGGIRIISGTTTDDYGPQISAVSLYCSVLLVFLPVSASPGLSQAFSRRTPNHLLMR